MNKVNTREKKKCKNCGISFLVQTTGGKLVGKNTVVWRKRKYCSKSCAMKVNRGNKPTVLGMRWKLENSKRPLGIHPKSEFKKGFMPWNKGKKMSKEMIEKMRASKILYFKNGGKTSKGIKRTKPAWNKGKKSKFSQEHFKKIGILGLKKQSCSKEPTSIEKKVYEELSKRGYIFEKQKVINGKFLVDAYIPSLNLIIEADGDYWHSLERVVKKDKAENEYLKKCGFNLVRWREADINTDIKNLFFEIEN